MNRMILFELLIFVGLVVFLQWDLRKMRREQRRDREAKGRPDEADSED